MESGTSLASDEVMAQSLPAPSHHRHFRYSTPETSAPPHFILAAAPNGYNHRPRSNNHRASSRASRNMSDSPPPPPTLPSSTQLQTAIPDPGPLLSGQDHDRMETDDGGDDSDGPESEEDEMMDTTSQDNDSSHDIPPHEGGDLQVNPSQNIVEPHVGNSTGELVDRRPEPVHDTKGDNTAVEASQPAGATDLESMEDRIAIMRATTDLDTVEGRRARIRDAERELAAMSREDDPEGAREENDEGEAVAEDAEVDDESDDSTDEDELPYWVNLKEDTSRPDKQEWKEMRERENALPLFHGLLHGLWEDQTYEPLDDPEYVPCETGRIHWMVKGVHGTPEKPNREKFMRSPSVRIGEYYWNIKFYPHGNDGTEQLSIYIECSPTPREGVENEKEEIVASVSNGDREPKDSQPWGTAAQIGCVLYNPQEPQVLVYQKGCHQYYNDNADWGWTRFHGPWDEIHKRKRFQRQALLRNDTLAFTAYIRIVEDHTKSLWWHPPKNKPEWDSRAMIGISPLACPGRQTSALVAAVSSWMHLAPFERLIREFSIPHPVFAPRRRMRPAFKEFRLLYDQASCPRPADEGQLDLERLGFVLEFYLAMTKTEDVVSIWESLRRALNYEASCLDSVAEGNGLKYDRFNDILLLKQPDLHNSADAKPEYRFWTEQDGGCPFWYSEPHSVQEALDKGAQESAFRIWRSFDGQDQDPSLDPLVLQIELHRQDYDHKERAWKKLTHRIAINETIIFNSMRYTLYGMIVHTGDLESKEFYSVIRPEGPGTRWVRFAGQNHEKRVSILTSKQAIDSHEGSNDDPVGNEAIAQIIMYVRADQLYRALCTPFKEKPRETSSTRGPIGSSATMDDKTFKKLPVFIFNSEAFLQHSGRGIGDPWVLQKQDNFAQQIWFPGSMSLAKLRDSIASSTSQKIPTTCEVRLYPVNASISDIVLSSDGSRHGLTFPILLSHEAHLEQTMDEIGEKCQGCRFWMVIAKKAPTLTPEITQPERISEEERERQERIDELQEIVESFRADNAEAARPQADTELTGDGNAPQESGPQPHESERHRNRRAQQLLRQLQQTQEQARQEAAQEAEERQLLLERDIQALRETYFLVKVFDVETQTLRGVGSAVVRSESNVHRETRKILNAPGTEVWDFYHERGRLVQQRDRVGACETFQSRMGGADGTIIVAQCRWLMTQYVLLPHSSPLQI